MEGLKKVGVVKLPPDAAGMLRAVSRIGYELPVALADLVDNSIDAGSRRVQITFLRGDREIRAVTISDNGGGMNLADMQRGMQFAGHSQHDAGDLGTYGMGLKSASFSQGRTLTVISRQNGNTIASRWSYETIGTDWELEILDGDSATQYFNGFSVGGGSASSGTVVLWQRLDRLSVGADPDALDEFFNTALPRLEAHFGLVFHRFLQSNRLSISIVVRHERRPLAIPREVEAHDPFNYPNSGMSGWPKLLRTTIADVGDLELHAHIWPPGFESDDFLLGSKKGIENQGFYFYRNDRLIQAGGWNGVIKSASDPELSLARVSIELPPGGFDVNVQKSAIQVSASQAQDLLRASNCETDLTDYMDAARAVYKSHRRADGPTVHAVLVPGMGIPAEVRRRAVKRLAGDRATEELAFVWEALDDDKVFDLDLTNVSILLNINYRQRILGEDRASAADAPLVKMLLFLLFKEDFDRVRVSKKHREWVDMCNALLLDVIKSL